jgi:tRNA-2-methylthio-N6-dimethylallyladenosine synthase
VARKLFVKTFGCQMNQYDSAKMLDVLKQSESIVATQEIDEADIILFNTCSVREKAQEKVFSDLGRARQMKQLRPELIIGVGGCVASQEGAAIVARAPYVDLVFGPQTLHRLPQLLEARRKSGRSQVDISFPAIEKFDHLPPAQVDGVTAFVSIMEGCSKYCSFCVVPYTRGEEVSRPFEDVLIEVAELAEQGVREVTLLGQNVNAYRARLPGDTGASDQAPADLAMLLEYVAEIPGIERIRYTTSHPKEFTQRLIDAHARIGKLATHIHLPVQSGSDRVLAAMKRGYTQLEYKSIVRRLRRACAEVCISSDFIVGFPGETDADFAQTLRLVEEIGFDNSFSFLYSPRPGTPAADLTDNTRADVKLARLKTLQSLIDENMRRISLTMVASRQLVLVEGRSKKNPAELAGRTSNNRMVNFVGSQQLIGQMVEINIDSAMPHSLRGVLCTADE